jgi:hypothetical protein
VIYDHYFLRETFVCPGIPARFLIFVLLASLFPKPPSKKDDM